MINEFRITRRFAYYTVEMLQVFFIFPYWSEIGLFQTLKEAREFIVAQKEHE